MHTVKTPTIIASVLANLCSKELLYPFGDKDIVEGFEATLPVVVAVVVWGFEGAFIRFLTLANRLIATSVNTVQNQHIVKAIVNEVK